MWSETVGRGLMLVAAIAALGAFVGDAATLSHVSADRLWVECWRAFGFLVFAGLFVLLAWRPRQSPLLWELVFLHKAAMVATNIVAGDVPEARAGAMVDLVLCVVILCSWILTRGWLSWRGNGAGSVPTVR